MPRVSVSKQFQIVYFEQGGAPLQFTQADLAQARACLIGVEVGVVYFAFLAARRVTSTVRAPALWYASSVPPVNTTSSSGWACTAIIVISFAANL